MTSIDVLREGNDAAVRPQDDLFGHVNGGWYETVEIPPDLPGYGAFTQLRLNAEQLVGDLLREASAEAERGDSSRGSVAQQIGDMFASFLDEGRIEELGAEPVSDDLDAVAALSSVAELAGLLGRLERRGAADGAFAAHVDTDDRRSDRYLVNLHQGGIGLPDEAYYREDQFAEIRAAYVEHLTRMLALAGVADPADGARRVMSLETRLAAGHWDAVACRDVLATYNLTAAADLAAMAPHFDFAAWAEALGASEATLAEVIVRQPSYLAALDEALVDVPLDDWKCWLTWQVVHAAAPLLSAAFVSESFDFYSRTLAGTEEQRARWKRGVAVVESALGEAIGELYVARHFSPEAKQQMDDLVANLVEAYRQRIDKLDWMGPETRQKALDKLAVFRPKIGYPETFRDYSALEVGDDLVANAAAAAGFSTDRELAKVGQPVDRDEWLMLPQTVNAYYHPGTNEICFPAAILQPPFFSPDADEPENYGGIGAVIGHEIGHGFDDQGAQYDGDGNLHDWWTADDKTAFESRSTALVEQYDAFEPRTLPGEHVNGSLTVGENIGDLGGLTIAHKAYVISQGGDASVEDRRTLFLNWSHVWRTKRRKEQELQYLTIDPHSPAEFRANIVRNLDEFHDAFETAEGDGLWLDPEARVRIW